jgi:hypothetical protein
MRRSHVPPARTRRHARRVLVSTAALVAALTVASTAGATETRRATDSVPIGGKGALSGLHRHQPPTFPPKPPSGTVGDPIATGLNAPFGVSVDVLGRVYVAETGFGDEENPGPGRVLRIRRDGTTKVIATDAPFVSDVDSSWPGGLAYLVGAPTNELVRKDWFGHTKRIDLGAYEAANNPDHVNTYGPSIDLEALVGPNCWAEVPPALQEVATQYTGVVDSNVFRTTRLPDGSRAVADAAGNDILRVKRDGSISTLVVLPPNVVQVSKEVLSGPLTEDGDTFPECVLDALPEEGIEYAFEPVPTGIAMGPDGHLYVAFLPGGEIPGAAKVVRVNLRTKKVTDFVGGFSAVTDVAFGRKGTLYLTQLFDGNIVQVPTKWSRWGLKAGTPSVLAEVPLPNGLAVGPKGTIFASILSLTPDGQVVPIGP